jgi:outer membrane protein assembly factor BamB
MVSLDTATGSLRWYVQAKPHDQFDHDFQLSPVLETIQVASQAVPVAIGAGKTGAVIAANAETGAQLWRASVGHHNACGDGAPLPEPSATPVTIQPGPFGGVLSPLAFANETVYVPVINLPFTYSSTGEDIDLAAAADAMVALNANDGSVRWQTDVPTWFNTANGQEIWRYQAGAGIDAPLAVAGDLLLVPAGGPFIPAGEMPPAQNALIALRLGGNAARSATPAAEATPVP